MTNALSLLSYHPPQPTKHTNTHTHTHLHTHTHTHIHTQYVIRRLRPFHVHYCNICCFQILIPSAAARACIVVPGSWSPRYGVLVSAAPTCIGVPLLRLQSYHHHVSQQFCIGVPLLRLQSYHYQYTSHNHTTILYGRKSLGFSSGSGLTM